MNKTAPRFQMTLRDGTRRIIRREDEDSFFRVIEQRTGLDRPMATAILLSGKPIKHPDATFFFDDLSIEEAEEDETHRSDEPKKRPKR